MTAHYNSCVFSATVSREYIQVLIRLLGIVPKILRGMFDYMCFNVVTAGNVSFPLEVVPHVER